MKTILTVKQLNKNYKQQTILNNINFDVYLGETLGIIGHNGAGKSTLLNCISKVIPVDSGQIKWALDHPNLYEKIGVHRQMNHFETNATVKDIIKLYLSITNKRLDMVEYLKPYGLETHLNSEVSLLSFGERQKLTLALALIHDPEILILDEMTTGVDVMSKNSLWEHIERIKAKRGLTVILVTHDTEEINKYADRVMILKHGEIVDFRPVAAFKNLEKTYIELHQ